MPVQSHPDQIACLEHGALVDGDLLRDVSDRRAAAAHRYPADPGPAPGQLLLAEQHLEQAGLAGPVGAQDRHELSRCNVQRQPFPEHPPAVVECGVEGAHRGGDRLARVRLAVAQFCCRHHSVDSLIAQGIVIDSRTVHPNAASMAVMFASIQLT
jgi:hypothetical protein